MTEAEWLACGDRHKLVYGLPKVGSGRKLRLFACACCRRVWDKVNDERSRKGIEVAEAVAEGTVPRGRLGDARKAAQAAHRDARVLWVAERIPDLGESYVAVVATEAAIHACQARPIHAAHYAPQSCEPTAAGGRNREKGRDREARAHVELVRDIFGNPFRPVKLNRKWLTSTVVAVAKGMYESREFSAMPILADALQDAGCNNSDILDHCRGPGPHVRGCWVVDLVLGKK